MKVGGGLMRCGTTREDEVEGRGERGGGENTYLDST